MPDPLPTDSVGIVTPQTLHFDTPITLACGQTLESYDLVIETYGKLNADATNAVLICHALSGHHHAAGYHSKEDRKPDGGTAALAPASPSIPTGFSLSA